MSETAILEQRITAVEHAIVDIKHQLKADRGEANWLDKVTGSISDEAAFREALDFGRDYREADRPGDEDARLP